jgi:Na+/melibiose symporter-like transporter
LSDSLLLVTYFLGYFGFTVWAVNTGPFLTAATSERERSHAFSSRQVLSALGAFVGSLVAGFLPGLFAALLGSSPEDPAPYRYALLSAGALLFAGVPLLAATGSSVVRSPDSAKENHGRVPLTLIFIISAVCLLSIIGEGAARTFFNVYLDTGLSIPTSRIGTLSAVAQLLALPAATAMPLLAARVGKEKTVLFGSAARALCLLPLALLPHWLAAGGGFVGVVMLASFSRPVFTEYQQESVPPRWRAAMSGATTMAAGLSWAVASFGGGFLVAAIGYRALFLVGSALSLVGVGMFWAHFVAPDQRASRKSLALPAPSSPA